MSLKISRSQGLIFFRKHESQVFGAEFIQQRASNTGNFSLSKQRSLETTSVKEFQIKVSFQTFPEMVVEDLVHCRRLRSGFF